jgi:hypothetical protein
VLNALVAYRLTRLWIEDALPPLPRVRQYLGRRAYERWTRQTHPAEATTARWSEIDDLKRAYDDTPPLSYLLDCYWCSGFWISLAVFLVASLIPLTVWILIAVPFALSAVVGLLGSRH